MTLHPEIPPHIQQVLKSTGAMESFAITRAHLLSLSPLDLQKKLDDMGVLIKVDHPLTEAELYSTYFPFFLEEWKRNENKRQEISENYNPKPFATLTTQPIIIDWINKNKEVFLGELNKQAVIYEKEIQNKNNAIKAEVDHMKSIVTDFYTQLKIYEVDPSKAKTNVRKSFLSNFSTQKSRTEDNLELRKGCENIFTITDLNQMKEACAKLADAIQNSPSKSKLGDIAIDTCNRLSAVEGVERRRNHEGKPESLMDKIKNKLNF